LNEIEKELIAIGVSIGAHCQPCLDYHVSKAREMGISETDIKEAVEIGYMVERGATAAMKKHAESVLGQADSASKPCCSDSAPKSCC
jgi:AhpD family alkylhydroperoxidase